MAKATCSVDGCERGEFCKTWCHAHYNRWRRNGDVGSADVQSRRKRCSVEHCDERHHANGYCINHNYRWKSNGDPLVTRSNGGPLGEDNKHWKGDDVAYSAVHRRLRVTRGPAKNFACCKCGTTARAWAYQHSAPDERVCAKVGLPYSTDLAHYEPMCHECHNQLDKHHGWPHPEYFGKGTTYVARVGRWRAYAKYKGKQHQAGYHDTREAAAQAAADLRARLLADAVLYDWQAAPE